MLSLQKLKFELQIDLAKAIEAALYLAFLLEHWPK